MTIIILTRLSSPLGEPCILAESGCLRPRSLVLSGGEWLPAPSEPCFIRRRVAACALGALFYQAESGCLRPRSHGFKAERVGFEPTVVQRATTVFETAPINHSGTSPAGELYQRKEMRWHQSTLPPHPSDGLSLIQVRYSADWLQANAKYMPSRIPGHENRL